MQAFSTKFIAYISTLPASTKFIFLASTTVIEYIFPVIPGDMIVIFAGFLTAQGSLDLVQVFCAIGVGSILGGWLTFSFGRYLIKAQANTAWTPKIFHLNKMAIFQHWYQKWGYAFLLISRFVPGIRAFFFIAAGFSGLSLHLVIILGTISSLLFNACLLYLGHTVGKNTDELSRYWQNYSLVIDLFILSAVLAGLFFFFKNRSKP